MRPTDWAGTRPRIDGALLGGGPTDGEGQPPPPDCCDADADTFTDRASSATGGNAVSLSAPGAVTLVQSTYAGNSGPDTGASTVTFSTAPTAGNVLLLWCGNRSGAALDVPSGWTTISDFTRASTDSRPLTLIGKVSDGTETTVTFGNTGGGAPESAVGQEWVGFGGVLPVSDDEAQTDFTDTTTPAVPSITPTTGISALLLVAQWKTPATPDPGPQTVSGYTIGGDTLYAGVGNRHRLTAWYKVVDPASGSYSPGSLSAATDGTEDGIVAHVALETHPYAAAWVITEPNVNDGDDATYDTITGTGLLRVDLGAAYRIVRTRIRVAANTSGARTFTIKGANAVDFSDEVTLATIAFTATGSYTAQDVEATWTNTTDYRYYELSIGTSDTYRIHSWELYEGTLATDLAAHTGDTSDAHDASAISIADSGGHFTATDVEGALAELASSAGGFGWFDVTDYGAVGDGVTDDASAINDAITALNAAGGGVLYLPHASDAYRITSALTSITVACVVRGDGAAAFPYATGTGSRIEQASDTANVFTFTDPGWVIEDLAIINTEGNPSAGAGIVASTTGPLYARMNRIQVGGFYDCVDLSGNGRWTLTDSYIYDPVRYGIRIRGDDDGDHSISGCYIMSDVHDGTAAIRQEGAGGLKVVNTKINERGVSGGEFVDGISVSIGAGITTSVLLVANTSIENVTGDGIDIATVSTGFFGLVTIVGCEILATGNTGRAVKIAAATNGELPDAGAISGVVIASNVFRTDGTPRAAIELTNTDRVTMSANVYIGFDDLYTASGDTNTEVTGGASFATPSIVLGSSAAGGAASTVIRSDATIAAFDATSPTTQAFGDSAATGSVAFAARRDHKHGMPSAPAPPAVLLVSGHAVPFTFDEILQESDGSDFLHASA